MLIPNNHILCLAPCPKEVVDAGNCHCATREIDLELELELKEKFKNLPLTTIDNLLKVIKDK